MAQTCNFLSSRSISGEAQGDFFFWVLSWRFVGATLAWTYSHTTDTHTQPHTHTRMDRPKYESTDQLDEWEDSANLLRHVTTVQLLRNHQSPWWSIMVNSDQPLKLLVSDEQPIWVTIIWCLVHTATRIIATVNIIVGAISTTKITSYWLLLAHSFLCLVMTTAYLYNQ